MKTKPRLFNLHTIGSDELPEGVVYIGRGSPYGNPHRISRALSREVAIYRYKKELLADPDRVEQVKTELRGKDLACWCSPRPCHGEFLLELANSEEE